MFLRLSASPYISDSTTQWKKHALLPSVEQLIQCTRQCQVLTDTCKEIHCCYSRIQTSHFAYKPYRAAGPKCQNQTRKKNSCNMFVTLNSLCNQKPCNILHIMVSYISKRPSSFLHYPVHGQSSTLHPLNKLNEDGIMLFQTLFTPLGIKKQFQKTQLPHPTILSLGL